MYGKALVLSTLSRAATVDVKNLFGVLSDKATLMVTDLFRSIRLLVEAGEVDGCKDMLELGAQWITELRNRTDKIRVDFRDLSCQGRDAVADASEVQQQIISRTNQVSELPV